MFKWNVFREDNVIDEWVDNFDYRQLKRRIKYCRSNELVKEVHLVPRKKQRAQILNPKWCSQSVLKY